MAHRAPQARQPALLPERSAGHDALHDDRNAYNQLDFSAVFDTGGIEHRMTIGASFAQEDYALETVTCFAMQAHHAQSGAAADRCRQSDPVYGGPINFVRTGHQEGDTTNLAVTCSMRSSCRNSSREMADPLGTERRGVPRDAVSGAPGVTSARSRAARSGGKRRGTPQLSHRRSVQSGSHRQPLCRLGNSETPPRAACVADAASPRRRTSTSIRVPSRRRAR